MKIKEKYPLAACSIETLEVDQDKLILHHKSIGCEYTKKIPLSSLDANCLKVRQGSVQARHWAVYIFFLAIVLLSFGLRSTNTGDVFSVLFILGVICCLLLLWFLFLWCVKRKEYANFHYESGQYAFSISGDKHADFIEFLKEQIEREKKGETGHRAKINPVCREE